MMTHHIRVVRLIRDLFATRLLLLLLLLLLLMMLLLRDDASLYRCVVVVVLNFKARLLSYKNLRTYLKLFSLAFAYLDIPTNAHFV